MRDEDEIFAKIVQAEFDEDWTGAPPPQPSPVTPEPEPLPDFHLNLYDDDESYRQVSQELRNLSPVTWWALGLVGAGILITIAKFAPLSLPGWIGWVAVACFAAGVALTLWQVTHRAPVEEDDEGTI